MPLESVEVFALGDLKKRGPSIPSPLCWSVQFRIPCLQEYNPAQASLGRFAWYDFKRCASRSEFPIFADSSAA